MSFYDVLKANLNKPVGKKGKDKVFEYNVCDACRETTNSRWSQTVIHALHITNRAECKVEIHPQESDGGSK